MGEADGRACLVDVLPAWPSGSVKVHPNVGFLDLDVHFLRLAQDRHGGHGSVDAAVGFRLGNPLDAMSPHLVAQITVDRVSRYAQDDFLVAAAVRGRGIHDFNFPPLFLRVLGVHATEVRGEQGGFLSTHAGSNLEDGVLGGILVLDQHHFNQLIGQLLFDGLKARDLFLGELSDGRVLGAGAA